MDEVESRLWADLHGFQYWETSASSGAGIGEMFQVSSTENTKSGYNVDDLLVC